MNGVTRTTTRTGKVGLMYLSDYGYTTSGESTTDRNKCFNMKLNYKWLVFNDDVSIDKWLLIVAPMSTSSSMVYVTGRESVYQYNS